MNALQAYHPRSRTGYNSLFPFNLAGISDLSGHFPSFPTFGRSSRRSSRPHFQRYPSYEVDSCYGCDIASNGAHTCNSCIARDYQLGAAYPHDHYACSCAMCDYYDDFGYNSGYWSEPQVEIFPPPRHRHSGNWLSRAGLAGMAGIPHFGGGYSRRGGLFRRGGY